MDVALRPCVHAPCTARVELVLAGQRDVVPTQRVALTAEPDVAADAATCRWQVSLEVPAGTRYWLEVDGVGPLLDPHALDIVVTEIGPVCVARDPWPVRPQGRPLAAPPIVYEVHVKGFGGTYSGCIGHLDHVVSVGANVLELMPVHPFDGSDNYWGYMPLVWGAVHRGHAADPERAAEELSDLVAAAHDSGVHVWLDVVFNHTGEGDPSLPTRSFRGLDPTVYRTHPDGRWADDSGCGNDIEPRHPWVRDLVLEALDRYADLGIDGFRFDLASLLTRDGGGLVTLITEWAARRGVLLVAEPWDLGGYQVGRGWPWPEWMQWNDRFRDDVRSLVRGEPGQVRAVRRRVQGSPDLFGTDGPLRSVNFVTAHDGLTMHDLTIVTSDRHRSWDCGPALRAQQLKNLFTLLLLSAGTPMWVMGDEFARTQHGHDNPYDIDGPLSWVDWQRAAEWADLTEYVRALVRLRAEHPPVQFAFHGVGPAIDEGYESRSLAWVSSGLYVMVNAWWEPLEFGLHEPGDWRVVLASAPPLASAFDEARLRTLTVAPRSTVVLRSGS